MVLMNLFAGQEWRDSDRDNRLVNTVGERAFAVVVQLLSRV